MYQFLWVLMPVVAASSFLRTGVLLLFDACIAGVEIISRKGVLLFFRYSLELFYFFLLPPFEIELKSILNVC